MFFFPGLPLLFLVSLVLEAEVMAVDFKFCPIFIGGDLIAKLSSISGLTVNTSCCFVIESEWRSVWLKDHFGWVSYSHVSFS